MRNRRTVRTATVALVAALGLIAAACVPPSSGGGGPAPVNWAVEGDRVTVNNSQDEVCVLFCVNSNDEPYLLQIAFKVTVGEPNSAQAWRTGSGANEYNELGAGESHTLVGAERATATFNGVQPLDLLAALNPANKMDVFGTYTWAMESDLVSYDGNADDFAEVFEDALNAVVASATLPSTEEELVDLLIDLIFNNAGNVISLVFANFPLLGLGDDTLGGALYLGFGATGALGSAIDAILGGYSIPATTILGDNSIPPDIQGGGIFTLTGAKGFNQTFTGAGGQHTYEFDTGPA